MDSSVSKHARHNQKSHGNKGGASGRMVSFATRNKRTRTVKPAPRKKSKGGKRKPDYKKRIAQIDEKIDDLVDSKGGLFSPMTSSLGGKIVNRRTGKPAKGLKRKNTAERRAVKERKRQSAYRKKMKVLQAKRTEVMGDAARAAAKREKKASERQDRQRAMLSRKPSKKRIEATRRFSQRLAGTMYSSPAERFRQLRAASDAPSEMVFRQPPKPKSARRRGWVGKAIINGLEYSVVSAVTKNSPTSSDVHLPTIMNNKKRKKRTKKMLLADIVEKKAKLKDPKGGLTAAGRKHFKRTEGSNLKPGVKGKADTPEKMRRKGSFLTRFFTNPSGPMKDEKGRPTRLALSAAAWGEPVPSDRAAAARLAEKGRNLLERYDRLKKEEISKRNPYHDSRGRFTSGSRAATTSGSVSLASRTIPSKGGGKGRSGAARDKRRAERKKAYERLTVSTEQMKTRITPTNKSEQRRAQQVQDYMTPAVKRFKNPRHRAYAIARVKQMTSGKARPKGMSKKYKMTPEDVRRYEIVLANIFMSGRLKYGI